jgi:NitT/TauT family transport system substrate-binding protein
MQAVKLVGGALGFNSLPVFVADRQGIFARNGLKVTLERLGSVEKATAAVRAGQADFALTPPEGAITDFLKGGTLRIVGGNVNRLPLTLIANQRYQRIEDLRGARLGTSSLTEGTAIYTQEMLSRHGLKYPGDYEFAVVGVHPARWKALQEGTIDAAVQLVPLNFVAIEAGYANLGEVTDYISEIAFTALITELGWLQENERHTVSLLTSLLEATAMIYDPTNDELVRPIVMEITNTNERYGQQSLEYARARTVFARDLEISEKALEKTIELMVKASLLDSDSVDRAREAFDPTCLTKALKAHDSAR